MKKLFIINPIQFGHNNATYYYCKYLRGYFNITYICWDHKLPKIDMDNVQVIYVSREGNILVRTNRFLRQILFLIKGDKQAIVFIKYFKAVSLALRLLQPKQCFVLDIRTGSVQKSPMIRKLHDARLKFETRFFRHVTVISESLADKLNLAHKAHILPLGADIISNTNKSFEGLHLLYVGTLENRDIEVSLNGFKQFYEEFIDHISISYTIIGDGPNNEAQKLKELVSKYELSDAVKITGYIPHTELASYFKSCNIGVSYVPLTEYFDCQPVTKTFEYLLSGMPVIATNTSENNMVIKRENGVIVEDSVEAFCHGVRAIFLNSHLFDSEKIRKEAMKYTWKRIVDRNLKPYLLKLVCSVRCRDHL